MEDRSLLAVGPELLTDINQTTASNPSPAIEVGDVAYFFAEDGIHGRELWRTDGTVDGTALVKDIRPGPVGSQVGDRLSLAAIGDTVFFEANDGVTGYSLWKTDGTDAGTVRLRTLSGAKTLTAVGGAVFFTSYSTSHGEELWRTDGTSEGTIELKDIRPGLGSSLLRNMMNVDGMLYFTASEGVSGRKLWKSDGTPDGTVMVREISIPVPTSDWASFGGNLFFVGYNAIHGAELWRSDGTEQGTVMVADLAPGTAWSSPAYLTVLGNSLYFVADDNSVYGSELWKLASPLAAPVVVKDMYTGDSFPGRISVFNDELYFSARSSATGQHDLWKSDGTEQGTQLVAAGLKMDEAVDIGEKMILVAETGTELWASDGTAGGTVFLAGASSTSPLDIVGRANGVGLVSFDDGAHGRRLWTTDGTAVGPVPIEIREVTASSSPSQFTASNGKIFFSADDGVQGQSPWVTDLATGETRLVKDITVTDTTRPFVEMNGRVYFGAYEQPSEPGLWSSDGAEAGTTLIKQFAFQGWPRSLVRVGDSLFFVANGMFQGFQLWKSDGTPEGTQMVADLLPGLQLGIRDLVNLQGTLFFVLKDTEGKHALWKSDGTTAGTVQIKQFEQIPLSSSGSANVLAVGETLYFVADDGVIGQDLWKSDGTPDGTVPVMDIEPGAVGSNPQELVNAGGTLYFRVTGGDSPGLWASDGYGVYQIHVSFPGGPSVAPTKLTAVGNDLYYFNRNGDFTELWRTEGIYSSVLVKDDFPASGLSSGGDPFIGAQGNLYFAIDDGVHGKELWRSGGYYFNTVMVSDLRPGPFSSNPQRLAYFNDTLFFSADDGVTGQEIWTLNLAPPLQFMDDGDPRFALSGEWLTADNAGLHGDYRAAIIDPSTTDIATWTFRVTPGRYAVWTTWLEHPVFRASNAPFTVLDGTIFRGGKLLDQRQPPFDFYEGDTPWAEIGVFDITDDTLVVRLSTDGADGWVVADSVRIERLADLAVTPEIQVTDGVNDVTSSLEDYVNFGAAQWEQPLTKTFTISNSGEQELTIGPLSALPAGFTLLSPPAAETLTQGESTTFTVRLDAAVPGGYFGPISFTTNDPDESLFEFNIQGWVWGTKILDNGQPGYSQTGDFQTAPVAIARDADASYVHSQAAPSEATWTFTVTPGYYWVDATWFDTAGNALFADNASFTIFDGDLPVANVSINQWHAPDDWQVGESMWENLGYVQISGTTLTVRLTNAGANGYVLADAIRVEFVEGLWDVAEIAVAQDQTAVVDNTGSVNFGAIELNASLDKTFTIANVGLQPLTIDPNSFTVPDGYLLVSPPAVSNLDPGQRTTFVVRLNAPVQGTYAGQVIFTSNDADEHTFNFNVTGTVLATRILDNGDSGYNQTGDFVTAPVAIARDGDASYAHFQAAPSEATWTFTVAPGEYWIAATWFDTEGLTAFATNAPFTILDDGTPVATVFINQRTAPNDFSEAGSSWEYLVSGVNILGTTLTVRLTNVDADGYVLADAIRIIRIDSPQVNMEGTSGQTAAPSHSANNSLFAQMSDESLRTEESETPAIDASVAYWTDELDEVATVLAEEAASWELDDMSGERISASRSNRSAADVLDLSVSDLLL